MKTYPRLGSSPLTQHRFASVLCGFLWTEVRAPLRSGARDLTRRDVGLAAAVGRCGCAATNPASGRLKSALRGGSVGSVRPAFWRVLALLLCLGLLGGAALPAKGAVVTNCSIYGPGPGTLSNALFSGESLITFACDGVIPMPTNGAIGISSGGNRLMDAQGHSVVLNGQRTTNSMFFIQGGQLKLTGLTLSNCLSVAVWVASGASLTATNCVFTRNNARSETRIASGGGLYSVGSTLLVGCSFVGNAGFEGGAIGLGTAPTIPTTELIGCVLQGNASSYEGGGIFSLAPLTLRDCVISTNAGTFGGGIYFRGAASAGASTVSGCTISGNVANQDGGGIYNYSPGVLTVQNSTFSSNSAGICGGGIYYYGTATVRNSTFSGNTAPGGAGIQTESGTTLTISHTLLARGASGPNFASLGSVINRGFNLSDDASASAFATQVADLKLGPLGDNGGPTFTHALLPGSPAYNAGTNVAIAGLPYDPSAARGIRASTARG
jgi:hypothetical protein